MAFKAELNNIIIKLKEGILRTMGANVLNKVVGMISAMVITRLLPQNEYGIWSYALNIYSYLLLITGFGLITGALQFGTENHGEGKGYEYFKYCLNKGLVIDFIIVILFGIIIYFKDLPIDGAKPFVLVILPLLLIEYVVSIGDSILRSQNRIKEYANLLNVNTCLVMLGTCGGAFWGLSGSVTGRYLANFLTILYLYKLLSKEIPYIKSASKLGIDERKHLWHYSLFTGASSAMNCIMYYLDVTLIATLIKNANDVGLYKVGTLIPNALQFIPNSIIVAVLPTIIYNKNSISWVRSNVKRIYLSLTALNIAVVGCLIVFAPVIIRFISGEKYEASIPVLRVLALGYFFSGTFRSLSVNILAAFRRVKFGLFISIISCFLDIILNYYLITTYGMIGAAYATLLVDVITAAISFGYVAVLLREGNISENT